MPRMKSDLAPVHPPQTQLLDYLLARLGLKNDAALARLVKMAPPVISKIRHGRLAVGAALILAIHENGDVPVADIRAQMQLEEVPA